MAGVRRLAPGDFLRRAGTDDLAAAASAFGSQVDKVVGSLDDVQIVLNDEHRVTHLHQPLEHFYQAVYVGGVQAGGGLIQNIDGAAGGTLGQLRGQLDPLSLAARQGGSHSPDPRRRGS